MINELLEKLGEQLMLVGISMSAAIIIGVPLGILLTRIKKIKSPVIGFASVMQTIPSLALLAF